MSKVINLDNLKRFYAKCKEHFADKDDTTRAINEVGEDVAEALHLINGEQSAFHVGNVVQETGDSTTNVMSQDAVTKALASAGGGGDWELITQFTADAGKSIGLVEDVTPWKKFYVMIERPSAGGATYATRFYMNGISLFNSTNTTYMWQGFMVERVGNTAIGILHRSANNNKEVLQAPQTFYKSEYNWSGALTMGAGADVFSGTELVTIYGIRK